MGVVIINGKNYDSRTGLPMESVLDFAVERSGQKTTKKYSIKRTKRSSKQTRMAEEIAREFESFEQPFDRSVTEKSPEPVIEEKAEQKTTWIKSYLDGEEPIEIDLFETEDAKKGWINNYLTGSEPEAELIQLKYATPEWISSFASPSAVPKSGWITNYLAGNDPIEIEPLEPQQAEFTEKIRQKFMPSRQEPHHISRAPKRSEILNRSFVKKPISTFEKVNINVVRKYAVVDKHPSVSRFAQPDVRSPKISTDYIIKEFTKSLPASEPVNKSASDEAFAKPYQPIVTAQSVCASDLKPTGSVIKSALINEQSTNSEDFKSRRHAEEKTSKSSVKARRFFKAPTLITAALAVVVLGGYFAYVNMPAISIRVAASQAGIDAHVPYTPSGYSIDGPVAHAAGQIKINYKSNGGEGYSVTQQENSWSNSDVVQSLLRGEDYRTVKAGDTTVYRYNNNAAWIKGNILYTLNGNGSLGDDQIKRIADSV